MANLTGSTLGQYEVLELLGHGGMATVYKARQPSMDRFVAIKVISGDLLDNPEFIARFEREARMIARLQHAHILPVYDYGRDNETLYLVMRLVDGGSLDQRLRQGPMPLADASRLLTQIGSALTYAHNEGIIHRDLKPNNILLDRYGAPYLTDFGIAKWVTSSVPLTVTGTVVGTPSYMAPEQWRGDEIDARTDVYALGVMLYEMLTGKLPFTGDTPYILMYKHFDELPPTPTALSPDLPEGVNAVIHKAMAKDPQDRYASADEMAAAFSAVLSPLPTRPLGVAADEAPTFIGPVDPGTTGAQVARKEAVAGVQAVKPVRLPLRRIALAGIPLLAIVLAAIVFVLTRPQPFRKLMSLQGHQAPIHALTWSPDGSRLASGAEDNTVNVWDAASGKLVFTMRGHTDMITSVAWSPDGSKLASASSDGTVRLWNPARGEVIATLATGATPNAVSWNPDGFGLAAGLNNGGIQVWDLAHDNQSVVFKHAGSFLEPVAWSPDGKIIACGSVDNSVDLLSAKDGKLLGSFPGHTDIIYQLAWNQDGSRLSSTSHDGTARLWDLTTGKALPLLTLQASNSGVMVANWSPDSKELATSSGFTNLGGIDDPTVKIWSTDTGKLLYTLREHAHPVMAAVWNPDGTKLATAGVDAEIIIWATDK